jgi:hypothetical protein
MTRSDFPNKPGEYNIDGVNIIILPDKIIIDTGARQTTTQSRGQMSGGYPKKKTASAQSEKKEKKGKGSMFNDILDNAQNILLYGEPKKGR